MEAVDDGSSTESEYYGLSEDEEPFLSAQEESRDLRGHGHRDARANDGETGPVGTAVIDLLDDDDEADDDESSTAFTAMATEWNNILTPDLAAAVARIAAHTARRGRPSPLAIPLDPPVETLPRSAEFVSPFAALATPTPQPPVLKKEKLRAEQPQTAAPVAAAIEMKREAVETPRPRVPARIVIDLSLDSDDDEENEVLVRRLPTPPAQPTITPSPAAAATRPVPVTAQPSHPRVTVSDIPPAPATRTRPPPVHYREHSSRHTATTSAPLHAPRPPPQPAAAPPPRAPAAKLTLSCTRCHRLVPDHSAAPADRARFDCKCCGRKYAPEELSVPGANRRCKFCKVLTPTAGAPPSSATAASVAQPQTPDETATHEASISPAAAVITPSASREARASVQHPHNTRPPGSLGSTLSRPATLLPTPPPVPFTCVTCHQPLKTRRPLAAVQRELDPWFCTCCQRLLCMKDSPPDKGPLGTKMKGIPRCMCCAIAACDLDSQLEARRPHVEPLQELRRLSRLLQTMVVQHLKNNDIERDPIKIEIDKRFAQWRGRMLNVRGGQRRTLRRDNVSLQQQRHMFREQLSLEQEEVDVRSRLVAYLAVTLHAHRVPLPREVRGIVGDDRQEAAPATEQRPKPRSTNSTTRPPPQGSAIDRAKARSIVESQKVRQSDGVTRRAFFLPDRSATRDARQTSAKRHKGSRYLSYQSNR